MCPWKRSVRSRLCRLQLGIEIEATGLEAATTKDFVQGQAQFLDGVRELVGVPAVLRVAPVGVDAAEDPGIDGVRHLVVEAVAGQGRVVHLDVDEQVADEVVALRKPSTVAQS